MKNKFFLLSTIISSCIFTPVCYADASDNTIPVPPKRSCYPASKCTGDPNLMGGYGYDNNNMGGQNGMMGSPSNKVLQTQSTEQFEGTVKSVNRVALPNQTQIQLVLTTADGDMLVVVGPSNVVDQGKVKLQAGDKITVVGYRINANGNPMVMAASIKKNGYELKLLNENRQPVWGTDSSVQDPMQPGSRSYTQQMPYSGTQNPYMPNSRY